MRFKNLILAQVVTTLVWLPACKNRPTDAQLQAWHQEAVARNAQMVAAANKVNPAREWNLVIQGQTATGEPEQLNWQQLQAVAKTDVQTQLPFKTGDTIFDFRGVPVATLLDKFGAAKNIAVTFVAFDGYRATVSVADLWRYPIILALERNGKTLPRYAGGPMLLVFPHAQYPALQQKYPERFWVFYVTHLVIGTEPVRLRVGGRDLNAAALDQLPQVTLETEVGYRQGWSNSKVKLQGVRVRDVLSAAGIQLPSLGAVVVRGKPPIYHDAKNPIRLAASQVRDCDILLVTRWGDNRQPIPASLGGPVTLAFSPVCQTGLVKQPWVTFVEELEVDAR